MLVQMLGSKSKIMILKTMLTSGQKDFTLEDIARITKMSNGTLHPSINQLLDTRIIKKRRVGRSGLYSVNKSHFLYKELRKIIRKEMTAHKDAAKEFVKKLDKKGISQILLFGSVARGGEDPGDVDILIITEADADEEQATILSLEILDRSEIYISPIFISAKDARTKVKRLDPFIRNALSEGISLYGDDTWLKA